MGFHTYEAEPDFEWSDGDALLLAEMFANFAGPFEVSVHPGATARYIEDVAVARAA